MDLNVHVKTDEVRGKDRQKSKIHRSLKTKMKTDVRTDKSERHTEA